MAKSNQRKPKAPGHRVGANHSAADRDALREAFADVKPLAGRSKKRAKPLGDDSPSRSRPNSAKLAPRLQVEREGDGAVLGQRVKTHASILERLEDPRLKIEAECDLHGMTTSEADREVLRFVRDQQGRGRRWVLIIAGKGLHSPSGEGTLREHIVGTLSKRAAARYVLAFRTAPRRHGGAGAFTVRLVDRL